MHKVTDFGKKKDDIGLVVEVDTKVVGAVWVRIMNDYGHINDRTPSLVISLYKEYWGFGMGTALTKQMFCILKQKGYKQVSLAFQKVNYAVKCTGKQDFKLLMRMKNISWSVTNNKYFLLRGGIKVKRCIAATGIIA